MSPLLFRIRGILADLDETVAGEPAHPALVIVVDSCNEFTRIVVPPSAKPPSSELLAIGRTLLVAGEINLDPCIPVPRPVATNIELLSTYH